MGRGCSSSSQLVLQIQRKWNCSQIETQLFKTLAQWEEDVLEAEAEAVAHNNNQNQDDDHSILRRSAFKGATFLQKNYYSVILILLPQCFVLTKYLLGIRDVSFLYFKKTLKRAFEKAHLNIYPNQNNGSEMHVIPLTAPDSTAPHRLLKTATDCHWLA